MHFCFFLNGTLSNFCVLPVSPSTFCVRKTAHEEITVHSGTDSGNSRSWQDVDYLTCQCGDETRWGTLPFRSRWWFMNVACHVMVTTWWRSPFMPLWWPMMREVPFHVLAVTRKEDHLPCWRGNMEITLHTGLVIHDEGDIAEHPMLVRWLMRVMMEIILHVVLVVMTWQRSPFMLYL